MIVLYTTEREYPWGTLRSTNASKVKIVLEEKSLGYRVERLRPGNLWKKPPEMLAKHPLGEVPWIEDEGPVVHDSSVINEYLEERYRSRPSYRSISPLTPLAASAGHA
ncbi:MAG TPA: glutathione S-transferase family protein [Candidatus Binatia bacterium]|nr:glutathione S-transferase family protein [Candidatus Binatia bacterium]